MIAKIPPKRSDGKTHFGELTRYIADAEKTQGQAWNYNTLEAETAGAEMTACAMRNTRVKDPAFHAVISWPEGETPTPAQARQAGEEALKALGFELNEGGHQALIALHLDSDNVHIHLAASRVHPETGKAVDLWRSKETLHRVCREVELSQGWSHDRGLSEVVQDERGRDYVVPSDYRNPDRAGMSTRAQDIEAHTGGISFERYIRDTVGPAIRDQVKSGDWQRVHQALARHGVELVAHGGGYAFRDREQPDKLHAKGGTPGSWARAARLEKALGRFEAAGDQAQQTRAELRYRDGGIERIEDQPRQRQGAEPRAPASGRKPREREPNTQRIRKAEREALRRRFERENSAGWDRYSREKKQAFKAAEQEAAQRRQALKTEMRQRRERTWQRRRELPASERPSPAVVRSLLAYEYAQRREALGAELEQARQAQREQWEQRRGELKRVSWRDWLRAQAEQGDEAAKRALRGLRYRNQEKPATLRPGEQAWRQDQAPPRRRMADLQARLEDGGRSVVYADRDGDVMRDQGEEISVLRQDEVASEQALRLASAKWGPVRVSGDPEWVEATARQAARLGIAVVGDAQRIWQDERERIEAEREAGRPPAPSFPTADPAERGSGKGAAPAASESSRLERGELDRLKSGIDLVELAQRFGWTVEVKESTRTSQKLRRGNDAPLIIQRRAGGDGFFKSDDSAKGDVISFYRAETGADFRQAVAELGNLAGIAPRPAPAAAAATKPAPDVTAARQRYVTGEKPGADHAYARARGIPGHVLQQADDVRTDRQYGNLWFAHRDPAGNVTGYEYKGEQAAGFAAGGRRQLYATGETEAPARLVIVESGLDALSKQAMEGRGDTLYVSIGGALSPHQVKQIQGLARRHPGAEVVAAFDADRGGDRYTDKIREAMPGAKDGREGLSQGQDWNDKLRQVQEARQCQRSRPGRGRPGAER